MGLFGPNLTVMERKKDLDGLLSALRHGDSKLRERAASALDRLKWEPGDEDTKALYLGAKRAWEDLAAMGEPGLWPFVLALLHKDRKIRQLAEKAITEAVAANPDTSVQPLIQALKELPSSFGLKTPDALKMVVRFLGDISDPRAAIPLIQNLIDVSAVWVSSRDGSKGPHPALIKYEELVKETLQKMGTPAVNAMVQEIQDKSASVPVSSILSMLGNMGEPAVEALIQALKHPSRATRRQAAKALRTNPDVRAVEALVAALEDPNAGVRSSAVTTLRAWRVPAAAGALARRLRDRDSRVREEAALALQELSWVPADTTDMAYLLLAGLLASGYRPLVIFDKIAELGIHAVEPLIQSLDIQGKIYMHHGGRRSAPVKYPASDAAIWMLKEIGQPAVEPLMQALKHQSSTIRCNAARALGEIKDARAKDVLTQALEDMDDEVKKAAKAALKKIR